MEVLREGYRIPLLKTPPLSDVPLQVSSYSPSSTKGKALAGEVRSLLDKGAVEPAPPSPGFYSRMFVVLKASGAWRPIIDLSYFNRFVMGTKFRMETVQSVLASVRQGDWMVSLDLKDAYLQVPIHPESRQFLRFSTSSLSPGEGHGSQLVSGVGNSNQFREVQSYPDSESYLSGHCDRFFDFEGFSNPQETDEFALANRRIPLLREAARLSVEEAPRPSLVHDSTCPRRPSLDESSPAPSPETVGFSE